MSSEKKATVKEDKKVKEGNSFKSDKELAELVLSDKGKYLNTKGRFILGRIQSQLGIGYHKADAVKGYLESLS